MLPRTSLIVLIASFWLPLAALAQDSGPSDSRRPAQERSVASSPADTQYQLGAEDVIQVQIWGRADLSGLFPVDRSGQIQVPLIGAIRARGRTPAELSQDLTERYQLLDPSISEVLASVAQYNSRSVTFVGEVESPGTYGFREMPDLWEALLTAGGPAAGADLARVQIVRKERSPDEPRTLAVNLSRGIERTPGESVPELRPQDTIVVPAVDQVPTGADVFQVLGAVANPGKYGMSTAGNLVEALAVSGGPEPEADLQKVRLVRMNANGPIAYELDLQGYLYAAQPLSNLELLPGDTITVPRRVSFMTKMSEFLAPVLAIAAAFAVSRQ